MDIWDYFEDRESDLIGASTSIDDLRFEAVDDERGRIRGNVTLRADSYLSVYLKVFEWIECQSGRCEVVEYSYYLIINGVEHFGFDKDPGHTDMPVHGHVGRDHTRVEADDLTLAAVLELAWDELTLVEETGQYYAN
jgi:hypothetical protein